MATTITTNHDIEQGSRFRIVAGVVDLDGETQAYKQVGLKRVTVVLAGTENALVGAADVRPPGGPTILFRGADGAKIYYVAYGNGR